MSNISHSYNHSPAPLERRSFLRAGLVLVASATIATILRPVGAAARVLMGGTKWAPRDLQPPKPVDPTKRVYFTEEEARQVTAIFDRLIPADVLGPSASKAGCVVFTDHQLASPWGNADYRYKDGPYLNGTPEQGYQSPLTPAQLYRLGLKDMEDHCQKKYGKSFHELSAQEQDGCLEEIEAGKCDFPHVSSSAFFSQLLANAQEGYFSDPVYGGNRNMAGWKMINFPGVRYDYRDVVHIKGEPIILEPVSIAQRVGPSQPI
ncbi:gluconate 2-dehydrogenase subunit 3 family protein [Acetobacteraceae bacterium ESL0709]|nr:gluconate 2-dehydrogenase subunit 3 family protein [Acetobacteraceae bacterium ESL0697]MDF7678762.1 gluconate 2-dehydrogenase subunit 3 family protein [Acetobacteraceae bacterium ESL0709]